MTQQIKHRPPGIGVDVGATLAKLAVRSKQGELHLELVDAQSIDEIEDRIQALPDLPLGLTGCGAPQLAERVSRKSHESLEFEAWGRGSRLLLNRGSKLTDTPYLLVSLGTGTSMLCVDPENTARVGGTALGGGTLLGLGGALCGAKSHQDLCKMAQAGDRSEVDLLIRHVYPEGLPTLPPEASASNFGLLARKARLDKVPPARTEDLALSVIGLVAENVALQSCAIAQAHHLSHIVYGGSALLHNPVMQILLAGITGSSGHEAILLEDGSHAGAIGALEFATD